MGKSKHIEVPFLAVLMNTVAAGFQTTACVEVGQHDFGVEIMEVGENGRPVKKYLAENGSYLHFDSNNTVQTFGILEGLQTTNGRAKGQCLGTSFLAQVAFVVMGFHGCNPLALWRGLSLFKPAKCFLGCGLNQDGKRVNISGLVSDQGARIDWKPMTITQKYFPEQLKKMQANQLEIMAFEARFTMLIENVCDLCLRIEA